LLTVTIPVLVYKTPVLIFFALAKHLQQRCNQQKQAEEAGYNINTVM
jgi:hypothetical protein